MNTAEERRPESNRAFDRDRAEEPRRGSNGTFDRESRRTKDGVKRSVRQRERAEERRAESNEAFDSVKIQVLGQTERSTGTEQKNRR
jgi:hypothetical protein